MNDTTLETSHEAAPLATIPAGQRSNGDADWFPPVDILQDDQEYLFKIDLPDVLAEDMRVFIERNELVISGERPPAAPSGKQCLRVERPHGHFERRFALPEDASRFDIEPFFRECVLELHVRRTCKEPQNPAPLASPPRLKLSSRT